MLWFQRNDGFNLMLRTNVRTNESGIETAAIMLLKKISLDIHLLFRRWSGWLLLVTPYMRESIPFPWRQIWRWVGDAWFQTYDLSSRSRELYQLSYPDTMQVTNNQFHSHFVRRPTGRCQGEGPLNQSSQVHVRECTPSGVNVSGSLSCLFWPEIKCSIGSCQFNI